MIIQTNCILEFLSYISIFFIGEPSCLIFLLKEEREISSSYLACHVVRPAAPPPPESAAPPADLRAGVLGPRAPAGPAPTDGAGLHGGKSRGGRGC